MIPIEKFGETFRAELIMEMYCKCIKIPMVLPTLLLSSDTIYAQPIPYRLSQSLRISSSFHFVLSLHHLAP